MTIDTVADVARLTTIPEDALRRLVDKFVYCITDAVAEAREAGKSAADMDIGIGTLSISLDDDEVRYKLIPGENLKSAVRSAIIDEQNLLERKLEQALVAKITGTYKDLL